MAEVRDYYVYYLKNKTTRVVFYVGASRQKPYMRRNGHLQSAKRGGTSPVCRYIRALLQKGEDFVLEVQATSLTEVSAHMIESQLILSRGLDNLTNERLSNANLGREQQKLKRREASRLLWAKRYGLDTSAAVEHVTGFRFTSPASRTTNEAEL